MNFVTCPFVQNREILFLEKEQIWFVLLFKMCLYSKCVQIFVLKLEEIYSTCEYLLGANKRFAVNVDRNVFSPSSPDLYGHDFLQQGHARNGEFCYSI